MVSVSYKPMHTIVRTGLIALVMPCLQAGRPCATLPGTEESRPTTIDGIPAFFGQVDAHLPAIPTQPAAHLWPREVGPLGLRPALTGGAVLRSARAL